jgi:hypothetical protein
MLFDAILKLEKQKLKKKIFLFTVGTSTRSAIGVCQWGTWNQKSISG